MKLPPTSAALLSAMLEQHGFATYAGLMAAAGIERGHGDDKALRSVVADLRKALRPHGVSVIDMYGLGFGVPMADMEAARALPRGRK